MPRRLLTLTLGFAALLVPCAAAQAHDHAWEGRLEVRHSDNFAAGHASTRYELVTPQRRIRVRPANAPSVSDGTRVVVRGRRVSAGTIEGTVRARSAGVRAAAVTGGARRTAVLLFNFTSDRRQPWTPDQVRSQIFTGASSTNAFYKEESYNAVSLTGRDRPDGDVYGWYTIGAPTAGCNIDAWASEARAAAMAGGANLSGYDHVIYVFPQRANCPWTGQGEMPGDESWINGDISVRVVAHELGHNMGVHHASSLRCWDAGGTRVTISGNCSRSEYGDPFDVMGSGSRRGGGWHLQQLGFLGAAQVGTVSASGSYTLNSITVPSGGLQLLRVPRIGTSDWYYLDFRTSGGVFDNFSLSDPVVKGVTVRMNPDPSVATQSNLLDGTPTSGGGFNDAPLPVGGSFSDGRISVTTAGVSGTTATVSVSFLDVTAPVAPVLTATASQTGAALGWSPSTDDRGVQGYRVMRNDRLLTTTTGLTYRDANVKAGASYSYKVVAFDAAGNAGTSQPVRVTIPKPPPASPRSAGPSIRIRTPTANQRVNRVLQVRSTAADRSVANMELWIDGVKRKAVGGYTLNVALDMTKMPSGAHVVEIRAYDAHGAATSKKMGIRIVRESAAARKKRLGAKRKAAARRGSKARRRSTR